MSKVDYIVSAGGGVYLPAIIIIHSTNGEVYVELCRKKTYLLVRWKKKKNS